MLFVSFTVYTSNELCFQFLWRIYGISIGLSCCYFMEMPMCQQLCVPSGHQKPRMLLLLLDGVYCSLLGMTHLWVRTSDSEDEEIQNRNRNSWLRRTPDDIVNVSSGLWTPVILINWQEVQMTYHFTNVIHSVKSSSRTFERHSQNYLTLSNQRSK